MTEQSTNAVASHAELLRVEDLRVVYPGRRSLFGDVSPALPAVDSVSFSANAGEVLGIAGESGCGKSTLGRAVARLVPVSSGRIVFDGADALSLQGARLAEYRRSVQLVFQDPLASMNPRIPVARSIVEPLDIGGVAANGSREKRVRELLALVGLTVADGNSYPHQLSGGELQRAGIARALALSPRLLIADEPVSALDVSIQAQVLELLRELRHRLGLSMIFITHDLSVMRHVADRVAVMYLGEIVELADRIDAFERPCHPYTEALISAIPVPDPRVQRSRRRIILGGEPPSPSDPPPGCRFHPRCPIAQPLCREQRPTLRDVDDGHVAACHFARPNPITDLRLTG
ncbi:MAG: ABC transporter ATP-binding protein [Coriobacteriales bacterium]|nr:ABC transporter ATP-binding protein [Coriobacteriales bacterium]